MRVIVLRVGHALVHIRPFIVLALSGLKEVFGGVAQLAQCLEPELGVFFFIVCGFQEQCRDLLIAGLFGNGSKVGVLVPGLRLTGKGFPQVFLGLRSGVGILLFRRKSSC